MGLSVYNKINPLPISDLHSKLCVVFGLYIVYIIVTTLNCFHLINCNTHTHTHRDLLSSFRFSFGLKIKTLKKMRLQVIQAKIFDEKKI